MLVEPETDRRTLRSVRLDSDLAIVGGGLAGTCCAITAAREGLRVVLVQDRPVLGGNASSEVRLWALGATAHMANNNRWSREGGVIDELLVENIYRNPEGNPHLFDTVLLDKTVSEPNITLLLNTAVFDVATEESGEVASVSAFCSQNSTRYEIHAPLFCDASGDGIVGFMAGAAFRMGAESRVEFGEGLAPAAASPELLGHTIYFYSKDTGRPVRYTPPSYALRDIKRIPRFGHINAASQGCLLWWLEFGGIYDTVHATEEIKWELWKVVYGVWDYVKNSGRFPEAENLTLEWVGTIPGKRESRRFEGDYMLTQQDIIEQRRHDDAVSFGGWAIDLHPPDGVYSERPSCVQWHSRGVYQIPYRCLYSRNVRNLLLAGRDISASHVAFGSTRVMATCAHSAQAAGMAAALCHERRLLPRDLLAAPLLHELQTRLLASGQHIPHVTNRAERDLAGTARVEASSSFELDELPSAGRGVSLDIPRAMLVPMAAGAVPRVTLHFDADEASEVAIELRRSERVGNFTPDVIEKSVQVRVPRGRGHAVTVDFQVRLDRAQYVFICVMPCPGVQAHLSQSRVTGVLSLRHATNPKVPKSGVQTPPDGAGVEVFEFWIPGRSPGGENLALKLDPPVAMFGPDNVLTVPYRPADRPHAWVAALTDSDPSLSLVWEKPQRIGRIVLSFDTNFDHAMESVQWGHPERAMPSCVRSYRIRDGNGGLVAETGENHQTRNVIRLDVPVLTDRIIIDRLQTNGAMPVALFGINCYET